MMHKISSSGFTLIELLVVMSVMAILGVGGIAAFVSYNQRQQVITTAQDIVVMLNQAKNRAQSQVKPSVPQCDDSHSLQGYVVAIRAPKTYTMYVQCGDPADTPVKITQKTISYSNVNFGSNHTFGFPIFYGGVMYADPSGTIITVSGYGLTKTITVYSDGRILLQ